MPSRALTSAPRRTSSSITSSLPFPAAIHKAETPISFLALTSAPLSRAEATALTSAARTAAHKVSRFSSRALADARNTSPAVKVRIVAGQVRNMMDSVWMRQFPMLRIQLNPRHGFRLVVVGPFPTLVSHEADLDRLTGACAQ